MTGVSGTNGGIGLVNLTEVFGGSDGPWISSLPQTGNFPTILLTAITGDGATVTGTTSTSPMLQQYNQTSFMADIVGVVGGSPSGCFNGTFTVTPTDATHFTYADACSGYRYNSQLAQIMIHDPGKGDNVSQVVSLIPHLP